MSVFICSIHKKEGYLLCQHYLKEENSVWPDPLSETKHASFQCFHKNNCSLAEGNGPSTRKRNFNCVTVIAKIL